LPLSDKLNPVYLRASAFIGGFSQTKTPINDGLAPAL
jgi:hypothetical protein